MTASPPRRISTWPAVLRAGIPPSVQRWWSGKPRLMAEDTAAFLLPSLLPLRPNDRLLALGPNAAALAATLEERTGFESPSVVLGTSPAGTHAAVSAPVDVGIGVAIVQGSTDALPFPPSLFTVILAGHQLRVWDDAETLRFLREAWRVLTHNGVVVLWEVAASRSARVNTIWRSLLASPPGDPVRLRTFAEIGRMGREAEFAWIQTLRLRPFLWPPGPRVAVLLRKEHYDSKTVNLRPGETLPYRPLSSDA